MVQSERIIPGVGDHLVSEALYLSDPDGNGIEIYRDRPRSEWKWKDGRVQMAALPIDLRAMLDELAHDDHPGEGLQPGTRIGHIHLQVADIAQAERFYCDALGFEVVARMPDALFISAGGYHHHIGMNTWESRNGPRPPEGSAGLRRFVIELPDAPALAEVQARLTVRGIPATSHGSGLLVRDPLDNTILLAIPA
jgi:catechol 2,3-dioxygenase